MVQRRRVLLVEDDRATRELFHAALREARFSVASVSDGLAALREIADDPPDVIVLDLHLPRVSGLDVYHEIVSHPGNDHIPILIVTGTTGPVPLNVFRTLRKPITLDELVEAVTTASEQARQY